MFSKNITKREAIALLNKYIAAKDTKNTLKLATFIAKNKPWTRPAIEPPTCSATKQPETKIHVESSGSKSEETMEVKQEAPLRSDKRKTKWKNPKPRGGKRVMRTKRCRQYKELLARLEEERACNPN